MTMQTKPDGTKILEISSGLAGQAELPMDLPEALPPVPTWDELLALHHACYPKQSATNAAQMLEGAVRRLPLYIRAGSKRGLADAMVQVYLAWIRLCDEVWREKGVGMQSIDDILREIWKEKAM